eukprot:1155936-Pelagomonas_calceolata.AAC.3
MGGLPPRQDPALHALWSSTSNGVALAMENNNLRILSVQEASRTLDCMREAIQFRGKGDIAAPAFEDSFMYEVPGLEAKTSFTSNDYREIKEILQNFYSMLFHFRAD